jgi:hypothetical protein
MKSRHTILRVTLVTAIFLGLQAGLCTAACAIGATEPTAAAASAMPSCHNADAASKASPLDAAVGNEIRSGETSGMSCCGAIQTTSATDDGVISLAPLFVARTLLTTRVSVPAGATPRSATQQKPVPAPDILLLKSTLLL